MLLLPKALANGPTAEFVLLTPLALAKAPQARLLGLPAEFCVNVLGDKLEYRKDSS